MKFMVLSVFPVEKIAEVAAASDKMWANQPRESRPEATYALMCFPFDIPPNSMASVAFHESDSAERIATRIYPLMLAGATVNVIPVMEVAIAGAAKAEKKYRG